ncbi:MAG: hypothetical protein WDN04_18450 [Rhodospirillales bacterium]
MTAGDLVFYGTMDGWFKAVDAATGALKWQFHTGSGIVGQPIAYRGPDGNEYVAVLSGVGGWGRRHRFRQPQSARSHRGAWVRRRHRRPEKQDNRRGHALCLRDNHNIHSAAAAAALLLGTPATSSRTGCRRFLAGYRGTNR